MEYFRGRNNRKTGLVLACMAVLFGIFMFLWVGEEDTSASAKLYDKVYHENRNTVSIFKNVYILDCKKERAGFLLSFLWNGIDFSYKADTDLSVYKGEIADIHTAAGYIKSVGLKRDRISGKVLAVSNSFVELEGHGKYEFTEGFQMYSAVSGPVSLVKQEIVPGYDNQEFVLENGRICAGITVRELQPERIRVLLKTTGFSGIYHDSVMLLSTGDYLLDCGDSEILVNGGESISISKDSLYFADGFIKVYPVDGENGEIQLPSISRASGIPGYEGIIELHAYDEGIVIINELALEDYLTRVVPSEMPASYGIEAAKVQAVCARSFAYRQIKANAEFGEYSRFGAHVDDSIAYQVYNNSGEKEISTRAVYETSGEVMAQNGSVIGTYYFSTSCGVTTDIGIWNDNPNAAPYLLSHEVSVFASEDDYESEDMYQYQNEEFFESFIKNKDDKYSEKDFPWFRWNISVDLSELSRRINEKLPQCIASDPSHVLVLQPDGTYAAGAISGIGELKSLSVLERGAGGVVSRLLIEGTEGTVLILRQGNIRLLLGDSSQVYSNGLLNTTSGQNQLPSAFFCLEENYEDGILLGYTLYGGGNGHGVGMSQNGVSKLSEAGLSYEKILEFFYEGAELIKIDDL